MTERAHGRFGRMRLELDRLDIHMGDRQDRLVVDVPPNSSLSELLTTTLVPFVPVIAEGWTFRAGLIDGWVDMATSGPSNGDPQLLVPNAPLRTIVEGDVLKIGARPTPKP